jgi:hypothetical protein
MSRRKSYRLDRVVVEPGELRPASWTFGGEAVQGFEQIYHVTDGNFEARNYWEFVVRIPKRTGDRLEVRPRTTPNVRAWAELPDRSVTFVRGTLGDAKGKRYCLVSLADVTGEKSRAIVRSDQREDLPPWFDSLRHRMRSKARVKRTRGNDGGMLVLLVPEGDHAAMIRLFFALKVWVLKEGFELRA